MQSSRDHVRAGIVCVVAGLLLGGPALAEDNSSAAAPAGALRHLQALQEIAIANGGNRAAGTPGYDRSVDYVAAQLREAGYVVRFEEFDYPFFEERTPPVLLTSGAGGAAEPTPAGVRTMRNSGSGDVTAPFGAVDLRLETEPPAASNSGCETSDFESFPRGSVALMRRGTCPFQLKVDNAVAAGARGVVVMNEGTEGKIDAYSGQLAQLAAIPVVSVPYAVGRSLAALAEGPATVRLAIDAVAGTGHSRNVIADSAIAGDGPLVMVGAHLDSVPEGPGINDNGSGVAAVLEAALELVHDPAQNDGPGLRFAFWGAEERGLVGSRHYVASLSEAERRRIAAYINLDMVASPNSGRFVQRPDGDVAGLPALVQRELVAAFRQEGLPVQERMAARASSDDDAFHQKDIPTVGLYTSAGSTKTEEQVRLFGGTAGPFDPCYHEACDTIANVNSAVLEENARALIRALRAVMVGLTANPKAAE